MMKAPWPDSLRFLRYKQLSFISLLVEPEGKVLPGLISKLSIPTKVYTVQYVQVVLPSLYSKLLYKWVI